MTDHVEHIRVSQQHSKNVALSIDFSWTDLGEISLDANGRLVFPTAPRTPGLYRFTFTKNGKYIFYAGQTDNLSRRFQHYRTPGKTQQTNIRLSKQILTALNNKERVSVATVIDGASLLMEGESRSVDLTVKSERVLLEHAEILLSQKRGVQSLNR